MLGCRGAYRGHGMVCAGVQRGMAVQRGVKGSVEGYRGDVEGHEGTQRGHRTWRGCGDAQRGAT